MSSNNVNQTSITKYPVNFVSLGPGDPELITIKGLKALKEADCIFCPETNTKPLSDTINQQKNDKKKVSLSRSADILIQLGINQDKIRRFTLAMSRERKEAHEAYNSVCNEAITLYNEGLRVCIVAEGDAGFYTSVHYVLERMVQEQIPVKQIAGIPAFIAAGALGNAHIVQGDERLIVVPGLLKERELEKLVSEGNSIVIMKLSQCKEQVLECIQNHPEFEYRYFENVGTDKEIFLTTPQQIKEASFPYFSLLMISAKGF